MKTIKILKVEVVEHEIPLIEFINSKSAYFEFIDFYAGENYPKENFILISQEVDSGEIILHEIGYVLCPDNSLSSDDEIKNYVIEHIDKLVSLEL